MNSSDASLEVFSAAQRYVSEFMRLVPADRAVGRDMRQALEEMKGVCTQCDEAVVSQLFAHRLERQETFGTGSEQAPRFPRARSGDTKQLNISRAA